MNRIVSGVALALAAFSMAWAGQSQETPKDTPRMMQMMEGCTMHIQGLKVAVTDIPGAVVVTLTTEPERVDRLRSRVEHMAAVHNRMMNRPARMPNRIVAGTVKYEEVPDGARLTLMPRDPAELEELRKQVRERAEQMQKGGCSMIQEMMQGMRGNMRRHEPEGQEAR